MNDPEENSAESVTEYPSKSITETSGESRPILDCGSIVEPDNAVADCPVTSGESIKEVRSLQPHVTQVRTSLSLCAFIARSPVRFHIQQVHLHCNANQLEMGILANVLGVCICSAYSAIITFVTGYVFKKVPKYWYWYCSSTSHFQNASKLIYHALTIFALF